MHGSIWCIALAWERLIDLMVARSAGVMLPVALLSFRRTSASRVASSPKSMVVGCGLQSATVRFLKTAVGAGGGVGSGAAVGGGGALDAAAAGSAGFGESVLGSSQAPTTKAQPRMQVHVVA